MSSDMPYAFCVMLRIAIFVGHKSSDEFSFYTSFLATDTFSTYIYMKK
jgi:hypothetical protein